MKKTKLYYTLFIFLFSLTSNCLSQQASFQGLGDLPGGKFESLAQGVSADGSVVIGTGTTISGKQAFRWTQTTGMVSLGNVRDSSFKESWAYNISADGSTIVGSGDIGSGWNSYKGFYWTSDSGMANMESLHESSRYEVWALSFDGSIIVGDGGMQAFRWTRKNGIDTLGVLSGRTSSRAVSVSADGLVAVGSSYNLPSWKKQQAFRWTQSDGMVGLGFLPGGNNSFANAVSPDGSVVVGTSSDPSGYSGFRWTQSTGMMSLGHLPGRKTTHPFAVSTHGSIIAGSSFIDRDHGTAFIWDSTHGMRSLQSVLFSDYGLNLTGWNLQSANGISSDGNVIVGWGTNPSGQQEAFRVVLNVR
jgi:probable HAF family extracellular repeat protein